MDKDNDPTTATSFDQTFSVATGTKRLVLKMGGSQGDGSIRIILDDLEVSANSYYVGGCNTAPGIQNDVFNALVLGAYMGGSVLANDADANGESLNSPVVVTPSPDGSVVLNADGTFTFTPNVGFAGTSTSFSYRAYDNGYDPASAVATVTINFPSMTPLPIQLISFSGSLVNNKTQLKWFVAENETGNHFEIEKSSDGTNFKSIGVLLLTSKVGTESYTFNESVELIGAGYYRLKIVNRNGSIAYSNIVLLKNEKIGSTSTLVVLQSKGADLTFNYTTTKESMYNVNVYNVNGAKMFATRMLMQKGMNAASLKTNGLVSSGVYVLEITNGSDRSIIKFIK